MPSQEQAFKAYYASMTDAELLAIAKNRNSFISAAQNPLAEELLRRHFAMPADTAVTMGHSPSFFARLLRMIGLKTSASKSPATSEQNSVPSSSTPCETQPPADAPATPPTTPSSIGATENQVSMMGTVPERVNTHGTKIEDVAGTGQHDSVGG